jgi:branched-chain amino acid transport system substrate-binding protein
MRNTVITFFLSRRFLYALWLCIPSCLLFLLTSGCASRSSPPPIRIGHVAAFSGNGKQAGEAATRGIRLAVEEINKDVESNSGRPIAVFHANAGSRLEDFEAEAVRLVAINQVTCLLGGSTSSEVEKLDHARVPILTPLGSRTRTMSDMVYCTGLSPEFQGQVLAKFAAQELRVPKLILVLNDQCGESLALGEALAKDFAATSVKKGDESTGQVQWLRLGGNDKASDVVKVIEEKIEANRNGSFAIVFASKPPEFLQMGSLSVPVLLAGNAADTARMAGPKELYWVSPFVVEPDLPQAVAFAKHYREAFQDEPDVQAALAYESIKLLHEAINGIKDSVTATRIGEQLKQLRDIRGLTGNLSFTADHQMKRNAFVVRKNADGIKMVKHYEPEQEKK